MQSLFPNAVPTETVKTKREELREGDAHWQWKIAFRTLTIILGLIGIGCAAWVVANSTSGALYMSYYFDDEWLMPWTLITFSLSVIWSSACIITFFARRPNAPVHPGAQVGIDLILWLGYIGTGLCAVAGTLSISDWGFDGRMGYTGTEDGYYKQASNGTWVWQSTQYNSYYGEDRPCNATQASRYNSMFSSCEEQDAYVNDLWKVKTLRTNLDTTATVCQFLALLCHLVLFVWACVDTHRRNRRGVGKDAEKLAADIVMNMVKSGAIIPPPGQAHFRPQMAMAQQAAPMGFVYPPQHYPQQYPQQFQPYPQQFPAQYPSAVAQGKAPVPQEAVAPSSDEKSAGPRYA